MTDSDPAPNDRAPNDALDASGGLTSKLVMSIVLVGAVTGIVTAVLGASPTGSAPTDVVVLMLATTAAVWFGSSAPWWLIGSLGAVGVVLADGVIVAAIALLVVIDSIVAGRTGLATRLVRAVLVAGAIVALAMAREVGGWGVNAAIAVLAVAVVAGVGLVLQPSSRRVGVIGLAVVTLLAAVATVAAIVIGQSARDDLQSGNREARAGLRHLEAGEFDDARDIFATASASFGRAADALDSPLLLPARLVPIVSQHVTAGTELSQAAVTATRTVDRELEGIDVDALTITDGRIDLDAVRALSSSMAELQAAIDDLDAAVDTARSGWLLDPVVDVLDELSDDLDRQRARGEHVVAALEVAPAMLGGDGERVYLVMFTTPAEARGQGGFMGNWAELSIDDGLISMTDHGNDEALNDGGTRPRRLEHAPDDWLARYGQFGFVNSEGNVGEVPWKNVTMSPNFPSTAQVAAELYPKSGGRAVDGVFNLDVYALATLVGLVGPIDVEGVPYPLNGRNTADFLLFEQYLDDDHSARGDMLDAITVAAVEGLLRSNPPDPLDLGKAMAPLVGERRVMAWATDESEQELFTRLGLDGSLRSSTEDAAEHHTEHIVSVALSNGGASKIDVFLEQDVTIVDGPEGLRLRIELTNNSPAGGLPDFIIGNAIGRPTGTSRLWVTGFASVPITDVVESGRRPSFALGREAGLYTASAFVELGPGASTVMEFDLDSAMLTADDFDIVLQALVRSP